MGLNLEVLSPPGPTRGAGAIGSPTAAECIYPLLSEISETKWPYPVGVVVIPLGYNAGMLTIYRDGRPLVCWNLGSAGNVFADVPGFPGLRFEFVAPEPPERPAPPPRELEDMKIEEVFDYLKARVDDAIAADHWEND